MIGTITDRPEFDEIDRLIFEINTMITKVCKTTLSDSNESSDLAEEGDLMAVYDEGIIAVISRFIQISQKCKETYVKMCLKHGEEAERGR
jgi:hypothetical protein